jgi:hypothetical protein
VTERVHAEEQQKLLMREMSHRLKNLFAVASSMVALERPVGPNPPGDVYCSSWAARCSGSGQRPYPSWVDWCG